MLPLAAAAAFFFGHQVARQVANAGAGGFSLLSIWPMLGDQRRQRQRIEALKAQARVIRQRIRSATTERGIRAMEREVTAFEREICALAAQSEPMNPFHRRKVGQARREANRQRSANRSRRINRAAA